MTKIRQERAFSEVVIADFELRWTPFFGDFSYFSSSDP